MQTGSLGALLAVSDMLEGVCRKGDGESSRSQGGEAEQREEFQISDLKSQRGDRRAECQYSTWPARWLFAWPCS
jgi:hypothetical protein